MREEIWQARMKRVQKCMEAGLNQSETAERLGLNPTTVRTYARRLNLDIKSKSADVLANIRSCVERGLTRAETATELGLSIHTIGIYGREYAIPFRHASSTTSDPRSEIMASMYKAGKTLEEIGSLYKITRERVRQILKKYHGIARKDGGQTARAEARRRKAQTRRDAKFLARYGCTYASYRELLDLSRETCASGVSYAKAPLGAYRNQERNAKLRGIEWNLSLIEWWEIWQRSGKWQLRGRGRGYMMCRFGDTGPYAAGNVYIATGIHNASVQPNNPYRVGHPDHDKVIDGIRHKLSGRGRGDMHRVHVGLPTGVTISRGRFLAQASLNGSNTYLGTFDTPEAAHSAYLSAISVPSEARAA